MDGPPSAGVTAAYDVIGRGYSARRRPDPRIAAAIEGALAGTETVLNVGAGAGSYEPQDRRVVAAEPSAVMIRQRPPGAPPVVRAAAEALPFADNSFDAASAFLTVHHWSDPARGLAELRRVARGPVVVLTFDPANRAAWLLDYLPELARLDEARMPTMPSYERWLGPVRVETVPVAHDCKDGFLHAWWRRPQAYLDPRVRAAISSFHRIDAAAGLSRLAADLESGAWKRRHAHLLDADALDLGYRLVVAG
jgi:SAM-dependent methyltransferase